MDKNQAIDNTQRAGRPDRWKKIARAVAFLLIFGLAMLRVQDLVVPNRDWPTNSVRLRKSTFGLENEARDSIEAFWVGSSHVHHGISPMEIYDVSGIRSYLISANSQNLGYAYYMLREGFKRQSPRIVAVDVSSLFLDESKKKNVNRWQESMDALPLRSMDTRIAMARGLARLRKEPFDDAYIFRSVLPILQYHTNIHLTEEDYYDLHLDQLYHRKGYVMEDKCKGLSEKKLGKIAEQLRPEAEDAVSAEQLQAFAQAVDDNRADVAKLLELCRAHGSELLLVKVPVCQTPEYSGHWSWVKHRMAQELADSLGVEFLDLNYVDIGLDWRTDTADSGRHLNMLGAEKVSRYLGQWLRDHRDMKSEGSGELEKRWDAQLRIYNIEKHYFRLHTQSDPLAYLKSAAEGDYTLLACVSGEKLSEHWTDALQAEFESLTGCKADLRLPDSAAFALESRNGEVIALRTDPESTKLKGTLPELDFMLNSVGKKSAGSIKANRKQITKELKEGLLIAVYDNELRCVVDCVSIMADEAGEIQCVHDLAPINKPSRLKNMEYVYDAMASL